RDTRTLICAARNEASGTEPPAPERLEMNGYFLFAALALAASLLSVSILAQPLGGVYTVANGNPGGAFDYGDIGDFFDDLEDFGVNAAVILELYDDGGPFISKESYQLGFD